MKNLIVLILSLLPFFAIGQNYELNKEAQGELKNLSFLEGEWQGAGWMMNQSREKMEFEQTEIVSFKLDGTALLIEGQGTSNGKTVHNAMAIVTMAEGSGKFEFHSFLQSNQHGTYQAELVDQVLYWYPVENVRYVIQLNDQGQWHEIGEVNSGGNWYQFFEMTLNKK
ncbi:hypothetical protein PBT90_18520 [Algoriphagus halophytocola]|uniref:DUF1579 domain-containing protein n=1 Tax=Algoriphagus halophytocola TaxID=2991499 RepID=A0ABY6MCR8_9BACT|nr:MULTISPECIES: hypothetical protein [unclassified Algoriphagus]UZD21512.1 hypothetical protein OM944_12650 [Algoriphagus sp. TR-M5]WBL42724.1 hypothetical protein PBT90_18520 [Algoriphagus sp. TR-M9]